MPFLKRKKQSKFKNLLQQLLLVDAIRLMVAYTRYFYYVKILRQLKTYDIKSQQAISSNTVSHNLKGMKDLAVSRSLALIRPLSIIESVHPDAKVLTIGPRTEGEILNLVAHGFPLKNISALDLITYSPWIQLGDMHNMPYENDLFDAVLVGWVIAYSEDPYLAAKEVIRVTKKGGVVAVGVEYGGKEAEEQIKQLAYTPGSGRVTKHVNQILEYFQGHVDQVYFSHSISPELEHLKGSVVAVFSIKK